MRIPQVPSGITGVVGAYLQQVVRQLNQEKYISIFSGTTPESIVTGVPGDLVMNIGSASTNSRLWQLGGSTASQTRTGWHVVRIA